MFRLKSLAIRNIRSIERLDLEIDPDGTTALFGPSGVGKSGILDAIPWCLWGDTGAAGSVAALRREGTTTPAEVTTTIQVGNDLVVATRRLTRSESGNETSTAKLWVNGVKQTNVTAASLTRTITEMTGLTAKTFRGAFYMAQDQLTHLMTGTPAKVQETFEELTGLDELAKTINQLREQHKDARIRAEALPGDPADVSRTADDAESAAAESEVAQAASRSAAAAAAAARTSWEHADNHARDLLRQQRDARASEDAVTAAQAIADTATAAVADARAAVNATSGASPDDNARAARAEADRLETVMAELTSAGAELKTSAGTAATALRDAAAIVEADTRLLGDAFDAAGHRLATARDQVVAAERAHTLAVDCRARLLKAAAALTEVGSGAAACPTCQQALPDTAALLHRLDDQIRDAAEAEAAAAAALDAARTDAASADEQLRLAQQTLRAAESRNERARLASDAAARADQRKTEAAATLAAIVEQITGVTCALDPDAARAAALAAHNSLKSARDEARSLTQAWTDVAAAERRAAHAAFDLQARRDAVLPAPDSDTLAAAVAFADQARDTFEGEQKNAAETEANARAARVTAIQLADVADDAATRWSLKQTAADDAEEARIARDLIIALRRDLLVEYCDTISAAATEVMLRLGGEHVGFLLDNTFVPQVVLPDGSTRATRQLSGGEKARAAVCAFIGISRQLSGGGTPGMILADEITAAQDETFRREMLMMLRSLEMPLIVVSHTADVLDIASVVIRLHRPPLGTTQLAA